MKHRHKKPLTEKQQAFVINPWRYRTREEWKDKEYVDSLKKVYRK